MSAILIPPELIIAQFGFLFSAIAEAIFKKIISFINLLEKETLLMCEIILVVMIGYSGGSSEQVIYV